MDSPEIERIRGFLNCKIRFLKEVRSCSENLIALDYGSHVAECNLLLKTRQKYLESLQELETTMRSKWQAVIATGSEPLHDEQIAVLNNQAQQMIKEILELDQQKIATMSGALQQLKGKLKSIRRGKKGIKGYNHTTAVRTRGAFTDSRR